MISLLPRFKRRLSPGISLSLSFIASEAGAGEALQKLRVAYAAVTAAFSIPWIAKEAGIFQKHGLDVELVYIAAGSRAVQTLVGGSIDVAVIGGPAGVDAKLAGADPKDFVDPRLLKEIEASGFVKKLYGEGEVSHSKSWSLGVMERWSIGSEALLHYSTTPVLQFNLCGY